MVQRRGSMSTCHSSPLEWERWGVGGGVVRVRSWRKWEEIGRVWVRRWDGGGRTWGGWGCQEHVFKNVFADPLMKHITPVGIDAFIWSLSSSICSVTGDAECFVRIKWFVSQMVLCGMLHNSSFSLLNAAPGVLSYTYTECREGVRRKSKQYKQPHSNILNRDNQQNSQLENVMTKQTSLYTLLFWLNWVIS